MKLQVVTSNKHSVFWGAFFVTLVIIAAFYGAVKYQMAQRVSVENNTVILSNNLAKVVERNFPIFAKNIDHVLNDEAATELDVIVDREIDTVFEAVYVQIPKFADFHYSLVGEYTQLLAMLTDDADKKALAILFNEAHFDERLNQSFVNMNEGANHIVKNALEKIDNHAKTDFGFTQDEMTLINQTLQITQADVLSRFDFSVNSVRFAGVGLGVVAIGAVGTQAARFIGKRTSGKIAAKLATRTVAKATGIGSGATTGAAIGAATGSVVPVVGNAVGAAVGGVIGAVAGWLMTDQVVLKVDELLHRSEFEADIRAAIDEQKILLKQAVKAQYRSQFQEVAEQHKNRFKTKVTTKELLGKTA
jgi:hypothetical protein